MTTRPHRTAWAVAVLALAAPRTRVQTRPSTSRSNAEGERLAQRLHVSIPDLIMQGLLAPGELGVSFALRGAI
jgi:hypothetical protein